MSKTILITGATSGIGRVMAIELAKAGHRVIATGRSVDKTVRLREEHPEIYHVAKLDVTQNEQFSLLEQELETRGVSTIDTLHVNAAIHREHNTDWPEIPYALWNHKRIRCQTFETNYFGAMRTVDTFRKYVERSDDGRILFMNGSLGSFYWHHHPNLKYRESLTIVHPEYSASKAALNMQMVHLARQNPGLFVASIHPGWVETRIGGSGSAGLKPFPIERVIPGMTKFLVGEIDRSQSGLFLDSRGQVVPF